MPRKNSPNELYLSRIYDAPVNVVWDAWVDSKQAAKWWGPRGFTITTHSKDLRVGGHWKYTMHGPDGVDYPNTTIYFEVEKHSRLVYDHGGSEDRPPLFRVTVNFIALKDKTKLEMTMAFKTPEEAKEIKKFIKTANGYSTWDRLAEYLNDNSNGKDKFVIGRNFDLSINKMFEMWTDPKHLSQWLPPTGFTMKFIRPDIRKGGVSFYSMSNEQMVMYGRAKYLEITPPSLLVYTQEFCDENEKLSRHPMAPTWPATMKTTVRFFEEDRESTLVNIIWEIEGEATDIERQTFYNSKGGMNQGWNGSLDKLEELLARL